MNSEEEESDIEAVSDTYFGENIDKDGGNNADSVIQPVDKETSHDPFNIYDILNKQKKDVEVNGSDSNIPFPPGFTPIQSNLKAAEQVKNSVLNQSPRNYSGCSSRILENSHKVDDHLITVNHGKCLSQKEGGIYIGGLRRSDQGSKAKKDWIRELNIKNKVAFCTIQETKMDTITDMEVKYLWGNSNFDFIFSEALGFSGGILCVWDNNMFRKEHHIISDNFVALYGTWSSNKMKILRKSVYAPHAGSYKHMLWSYLDLLISRWNGECIVMGDFNEVRTIFLDKHLSDHRPILLREILKKEIRVFVVNQRKNKEGRVKDIKAKLSNIDKKLDQEGVNEDILASRMECMNFLFESKAAETLDFMQKAKIKWTVEGGENFKFFHGMVNRKRANLAVKGIMIDGAWVDDPREVKNEVRDHFASRFQDPGFCPGKINFIFPKRLHSEQAAELKVHITRDEIQNAVWCCGENKSLGPDGFSFEFFCKFWQVVGLDFCMAVEWFFDNAFFPIGCNSSFIALISKSLDPKVVSDFRPISLIGCIYKVITKILQSRL
uniref:RNA-directed DNA polymerase, eukaryota n=1 Tax=Tanacetum cinerariifolium TaxID=118510 RepID=A0A699JYU2_TANCI|nr:RNA-directed DNA polymerase, eukaryota [Tanacetum cinerariifolium]